MIKANFWQDRFAPQSYRRTWLFIVLSNVLELAIPILCAALINSAIPNENGTMAAILLISAALSGFFLSYLKRMLVSIPPYLSVAQFMGFLKGKSSLMIFDRHANLKYKYGSRNFWCRGYYVDTVGRNKKIIAEYIRNQLEEDYAADQISIKEYADPFTGDKNKKA